MSSYFHWYDPINAYLELSFSLFIPSFITPPPPLAIQDQRRALCIGVNRSPPLWHCTLLTAAKQYMLVWLDVWVYRNEVLNWIIGILVVWGALMSFFSACLYWWHKDISKGVKWGQNGSQCGCTGVKHDQTAVFNRGIIVPKNVRAGWRQKDWGALHSYLVTH